MSQRIVLSLAAVALTLGALAPWGVTSSSAVAETPLKTGLPATSELGGADRFLTHLSTDKPIYREGETVYVRGIMLEASRHVPLPGGAANATLEVKGPKGDTVFSSNAQAQDSVLGFQWRIPEGTSGGQYLVKASFPWNGYAPAERAFEVRDYRPPRLKSQIVFVRDGYGPGDSVQASLHTERAEGGIPVGAKVGVTARVDGVEVHRATTTIDARGNCGASFALPREIARGDGTLIFAIEDGGVIETATKTIPILLQTLDLAFYPEGGELVAGLPMRVYVEARTPAQKPADLKGIIVDGAGQEVAKVATEHEGRGRFSLTPKSGESYTLKVVEPAGISKTFALPAAKATGAVVGAVGDTIAVGAPARLLIGSTQPGELTLTVSQREHVLASKKLAFKKSRFWQSGIVTGRLVEQRLDLPQETSGVLIATLWDASGAPLAERLLFRKPQPGLRVEVQTSKPRYATGDEVELTVRTRDAHGKPVAAVVGVTITDESVLEMVEKREQAPRLPVMVLLEDDVRELADAHVYLDPQNTKAPLAVDLLLGTQGWRRFALTHVDTRIARQRAARAA
ncbi:MAG: MG2 domain-containing protein, partial [Myxococcota bacterium]